MCIATVQRANVERVQTQSATTPSPDKRPHCATPSHVCSSKLQGRRRNSIIHPPPPRVHRADVDRAQTQSLTTPSPDKSPRTRGCAHLGPKTRQQTCAATTRPTPVVARSSGRRLVDQHVLPQL